MFKAVFDTNILFSATGWRGSPYQCLSLARNGKITLILCQEILTEYHEKLQTKLGLASDQATRAVAEILSCATLTEIKNELRVVKDDPDDDKVVECAVTGEAAYIVSGDRHLLDMKEYKGIAIVRASQFLALITENPA
ncbi:MAG TPA: putative toxin-antitoxin system toxin component, PIN family [Anaerolineales bacterium]|nr:putative toxin-antitoxin system toxin component, PIN family [Anaerolineales bacterium]